MSALQWQTAVLPAQLAFLAIYNPALGPTDETFQDQLVFYYSRAAQDARLTSRKTARSDAAGGDAMRAEENEKLRHIGLAQGMVDFARSFSDGQPVDSIDTEKSRIVLHEIEKGWWILASIDLTRLPVMSQSSSEAAKKNERKNDSRPAIEYSSREVSPSALLLSQLIQAHFVFTLHHGPSLSELFVKHSRDRFCSLLERFWTRFSRSWDVLLHGNPATDIFCGIKLSSGGELGMGVGEEEWGSGEREVLEDLTRRTEGLVDLVVCRFGRPATSPDETSYSEDEAVPWLGSGRYPLASDGVIFGGINAIGRVALRNVSLWMRDIYSYGDYAYGVRDNPHRERRRRRGWKTSLAVPDVNSPLGPPSRGHADRGSRPSAAREAVSGHDDAIEQQSDRLNPPLGAKGLEDPSVECNGPDRTAEHRPGIPPPIIPTAPRSLANATQGAEPEAKEDAQSQFDASNKTFGIPDQYMKYLTFGLSSLAKSTPQHHPKAPSRTSTSGSGKIKTAQDSTVTMFQKHDDVAETDDDGTQLLQVDPMPDGQTLQDRIAMQKRQEEQGQFVVGLKGDLMQVPDDPDASIDDVDDEPGGLRNILRTVQVEITPSATKKEDQTELQAKLNDAGLPSAKNDPLNYKRLRVLVYVRRPFMYCFLFRDRTPSLSMARFYKTLHHTLGPIHKPLLASTDVSRIAQRIEDAQAEISTASSDAASVTSASKSQNLPEPKPIYDLIWDPALLTVHTSIPNIPEPGTSAAEGIMSSKKGHSVPFAPDWTRVEALNVHSQILNTHTSTYSTSNEYERTSKTSRGWWVVWLKMPSSNPFETAVGQEAEHNQESAKEPGKENSNAETEFTFPLGTSESDDTLRPYGQASTSASIASTFTRWLEPTATTKKLYEPTNRIAFLVRKATEVAQPVKSDTTSRAVSSMWQSLSLRSTSTSDEATGGPGAGWGPAALTGGIGIDARRYVEGLLQLNR